MTPFFFGTGQRRLFGIYNPARASGGGAVRAAVLCAPWGPEYLHSHRSLRQLAARLSLAGFHTLRFDYFGTGDSAGEVIEGDLPGWEQDIETAIEELKDSTGAKRVVLAGLRLGATLSASVAAARRQDVEALVLWDPIVSGEIYLQSLLSSKRKPPLTKGAIPRPVEIGGGYDILGFPLSARMAQEVKCIDLAAQIHSLPPNTLILVSERLPCHDSLQHALGDQPDPYLIFELSPDPPMWIERSTNAGAVPVDVLNRIVNWLYRVGCSDED
jgi:pimeloyl-ACP methyl ester carboxylesterase